MLGADNWQMVNFDGHFEGSLDAVDVQIFRAMEPCQQTWLSLRASSTLLGCPRLGWVKDEASLTLEQCQQFRFALSMSKIFLLHKSKQSSDRSSKH